MQKRGYAAVGLFRPRKDINIGGALRAAFCYDASLLIILGRDNIRESSDTTKTWRHKPVLFTDDFSKVCPYDCVPVAVDLVEGATSLVDYEHPQRALYIFGPECSTLQGPTLEFCRDRVFIPTTACMNLAATVNVVLYDRLAKQHKHDKEKREGAPESSKEK